MISTPPPPEPRMRRFDAISVINLPSRPDRRAEMTRELAAIGLDAASPPVVFFDALRPDDAGRFPTIGTRGCFLSHLGVLRAARAAGHGCILVLEDDVNFRRDFIARLDALSAEVDRLGADFWYLGALSVTPPPAATGDLVTLPPDTAVLGAHMFAVTARAIRGLVPCLEQMLARPPGDPAGGPMHVDGAYSWYRRAHPEIRTVLATEPLGDQRPSRTDIHALRWFDRLPVVDKLVGRLRVMRSRLAGRA